MGLGLACFGWGVTGVRTLAGQGGPEIYRLGEWVYTPIGLAIVCDIDPSTGEIYVIPKNDDAPLGPQVFSPHELCSTVQPETKVTTT